MSDGLIESIPEDYNLFKIQVVEQAHRNKNTGIICQHRITLINKIKL